MRFAFNSALSYSFLCAVGVRKRFYDDKVTQWATGRADLVELQRVAFQKRQEQEMRLREDEHQKKMKLELDILELRKSKEEYLLQATKKKTELELEILEIQKARSSEIQE